MTEFISLWMAVDFVNAPTETSTSSVSLEDLEPWGGRLLVDSIHNQETKRNGTPFQEGDILFGKLRPYLSKSWVSDTYGVAIGDIHVYRPKPNFDPRFLGYIIRTTDFINYASSWSNGVKMPRVEWTAVSQYRFSVPPLGIQSRIADYLDREISEIDAMIEEFEGLLRNLDKRREPIIRSVFTRNDAMLVPLNLIAKFKTGGTPKDCREDENGLQWIKPDGLSAVSKGKRISKDSSNQLPAIPRDSALFCGIGTTGKVGYLNELAVTNQQITSLIPMPGISGKLIYYSLLTEEDRLRATAPRSTLPIFNNARLGAEKILMCEPELNEKVLSELDRETANMDTLVEESTKLIKSLKARKTALITEVVTGLKEV